MKKQLLLIASVMMFAARVFGQSQVDLPIDFGNANVNYDLVDFGGNTSMLATDPADPNNMACMIDKSAAAQTWAGTTFGGTLGFANPIPFVSGSTVLTMRVYSPDSGIVIRLKAENLNDPTQSVETDAHTSAVNTWEILTFDFANQATGTAAINFTYVYNKLSAFFNFGVDGATAGQKTYYCDDINFVAGPPAAVTYTFQVQNPDSTPVYVFGSWNGFSNWPGTPMSSLGGGVYTADIPLNPSSSYEYLFVNGPTPTKEVLLPTWPCTNGNAQYTNRTLTTGTTDSSLCAIWATCNTCNVIVSNPINLPITFDDTTVNYALVDFGGNTSAIQTDPIGGTNQVLMVDKSNTAQTWAGTTVGGNGLALPIPFAGNATRISMAVYSPDAGTPIRMKAENAANGTVSVETEATTTISNGWETLEFNFANQAAGTAAINFGNVYDKLSVFFNFGVDGATAGQKTYYCDDITFLPPVSNLINVTFQVQNPDSTPVSVIGSWDWTAFPGVPMTPVGNGIYSGTVPLQASSSYEFKFVNGGVSVLENLDPTWPCTNGNAQYTNRTLALGTTDTTLCAVWSSCNTCNVIVLNQVDLPVDFDSTNINYALVDFGGNASNIETDPIGGTNQVCKVIKSNTAQTWAGTTIGGSAGFVNAVPFASGATTMSMRIYSQDAGTTIRMKVEDPANGAISVETDAVTTTSNAWETLNFDFANQATGTAPLNFANNYQKLSVFFNFGIDGATAGTKTYYFDDVQFGGSVGVTDPSMEEFSLVVTEGGLYVRGSSTRLISALEIYDMLGRPVYRSSGTCTTNTLIPVNFDRSALYVVKLTTDQGTSSFKGVVLK
jgi:hypothetical protein